MLPLLVLVVVALVAAGVTGLLVFASGPRVSGLLPTGGGPAAGVLLAVTGLVGAVVAAAVVFVLVVGRGSDDGQEADGGPDAPTVAQDAGAEPAGLGPEVRLANTQGSEERRHFPGSAIVIDGLSPTTVLRVRVDGFPTFAEAVAEQCVTEGVVTCSNRIPVQFDEDGRTRFQYLIVDSFVAAARQCGADAPPCTLVVRTPRSSDRATIQTVFGDTLPPAGTLQVTPRNRLRDGQLVRVDLDGLPPGARGSVTTCAAPAVAGVARCGAPAPTATFEVGPDGSVTTDVAVVRGPVGSQRVRCGAEQACAVAVTSTVAAVRAPVVPITFVAPPGATYDPPRLIAGLAVAALLVLVAGWLVRRSDWSPVGEAAAPEIDEAEYADLDAMVAALPGGADDDPDPRA